MNPRNYLRRPEYIWRPRQVFRRFGRLGKKPGETEEVTLPWGARVLVRPKENVGADIYYYGIFDPIVPEAIWRLLDVGEAALDIGANIGQNTSAMAFRSGPAGSVIAFEPHPVTFGELRRNAERWAGQRHSPLQLENSALGAEAGRASLAVSGYLSGASLAREGEGVTVLVRRLDDCLTNKKPISVCKIDVEGHELAVLEGAKNTLSEGLIRDLIFEDFNPMPLCAVAYCPIKEYTCSVSRGIFLLFPLDCSLY